MKQKIKTLDFLTAGLVFSLAVNELISYVRCRSENYIGEFKGSNYLFEGYPQHTSFGYVFISAFLYIMINKYKACVYTKIVVCIFFIIQLINLIAVIFQIGFEAYDVIVYPIFLFSIILIAFIKFLRWGSQKHS